MSDVLTIGSNGEQKIKDDAKEKLIEQELIGATIKFRTQIKQVKEELSKGKTLKDIENEIAAKKSTLPSNARNFILLFNSEFIEKILNYKQKENGLNS